MPAAYIQIHFSLDSKMQANTMNPDQTDLFPYCLQYRLPKDISRQEEQITKVVIDGIRVYLTIQNISDSIIPGTPTPHSPGYVQEQILSNG